MLLSFLLCNEIYYFVEIVDRINAYATLSSVQKFASLYQQIPSQYATNALFPKGKGLRA
jgi:hypothetical protein